MGLVDHHRLTTPPDPGVTKAGNQGAHIDLGADPAQTYTATATGIAGEGMDGFVYTITDANVRATTITGGSAAASNGWTGNAACWVRNKNGSC